MQTGNPGHEFSIPGHLQTSIKISLTLYPCEKWLILVKNFRSSSPVKFLKSTSVLGRDVYYSLYFTLSRTYIFFRFHAIMQIRNARRKDLSRIMHACQLQSVTYLFSFSRNDATKKGHSRYHSNLRGKGLLRY